MTVRTPVRPELLACTLVRLARDGEPEAAHRVLPNNSLLSVLRD
jgi:hypothetical protein